MAASPKGLAFFIYSFECFVGVIGYYIHTGTGRRFRFGIIFVAL